MRRKSFAGFFLRYIVFFCGGTLALILVAVLVFGGMIRAGAVLPANYAEVQIEKDREKIAAADTVSKEMLPDGSRFGVYRPQGEYLYGTFTPGKERERAWTACKENRRSAGKEGYYQYVLRENGEVCVIRYQLATRFAESPWGSRLPSPMLCAGLAFIIMFILQAVLLSVHFSRRLSGKLAILRDTTENIRQQDLEFEQPCSDIAEIAEILDSLCRMKDALGESLKEQWEQERRMKEQIGALAHDIKTPLTVIRGNAELLEEEACTPDILEPLFHIRQSSAEIEEYLAALREILSDQEETVQSEEIECGLLAAKMAAQAESFACAQHRGTEVSLSETGGKVWCDVGKIFRAWNNLLSNALEYTPGGESIRVEFGTCGEAGKRYFFAAVTDRGCGFSEEALRHGTEKFYQGDKSRHDKSHRGLGLYIASEFAKAQGGMVRLGNAAEDGYGGRTELLVRMAE